MRSWTDRFSTHGKISVASYPRSAKYAARNAALIDGPVSHGIDAVVTNATRNWPRFLTSWRSRKWLTARDLLENRFDWGGPAKWLMLVSVAELPMPHSPSPRS